MTILVTGGAGFIGSHLCEALIGQGETVLCVDNLITGRRENIQALESHPRFTFLVHDISKPLYVDQGIEAVLHLASPASPKDYLQFPIQTLKVGSLGTHNALGLAKAHGAAFLLASTSEVYGDPLVHPQPETYWGHVNPIGLRGVYDEAKRFAEALTMAYHRAHKLDTKIARIFNTYGPRMRLNDGRVLPNFITQALSGQEITLYGKGLQTRCFCFVSDMVKGLVGLLHSSAHTPVNLGTNEERTMEDTARRVCALTKSSSRIAYHPLPEDDPQRRHPDLTRARMLLGWRPEVPFEEGLKATIEDVRRRLEQG